MSKTITIIGASGLIGNEVLQLAMENKEIERITIFVRKSLHLNNPKLIEVITDFKNLNDLETKINGDALICCLGTTRKKTPNLEEYKKIDFDLTINLAQIAKKQNIEQVHLISAIGADSKSKIFYNRLKGETEVALINIGFPQTIIYRPSLLIGKRNEYRFGELLAQKLSPIFDLLLIGSLKKYHSISASDIAKTIVNRVLRKGQKVEVLEYNEIQLLK
jgi:uncharacterized protein YbjT (DUF2867 family)